MTSDKGSHCERSREEEEGDHPAAEPGDMLLLADSAPGEGQVQLLAPAK